MNLWTGFYNYLSDQNEWLSRTLIVTVLLVPGWMGAPYFAKNHDVRPEWFLLCYMTGVVVFVSTYLYLVQATGVGQVRTPGKGVLVAMVCFGILVGGIINMLVFNSLEGKGVNPGIPVAITSCAGVLVIFGTIGAAKLWPSRFVATEIHPWTWVGIVLIMVGLVLAALGQGKIKVE